ncbi:MAG TPA: carbohydrate ABC transporter permease [Bacillaceae bacterium]|nr:carbohydrate ABC transporter permease [Paenibacillus bovis]HLU23953.1 carbohydrate ABC transporter permease [Bacillaceae bacterium]
MVDAQKTSSKRFTIRLLFRVAIVIVVLTGAFTMLLPFLWMILTSLKTDQNVFTIPVTWLPEEFQWGNYLKAWEIADFSRYIFNSLFVTTIIMIFSLLFNSMAGYAFAKYRFRAREPLFLLLLSTMMIPGQVTMIPVYLILEQLGFLDSYFGLIVPGLATAFGIFIMRQFMLSIPDDFIDAARIDGASEARIFFQIILPISKPAISALGIFTFVGAWNDFLFPLLVISSDSMKTLPLAIASLAAGQYVQSWPLLMAAATFITLPVIVVFFIGQRYFIEGIAMTGIKG